jgi:hypothetical protein
MIHALLSRIGIETWKDIPNFKNYQVSNLGNVKSLNYRQTSKAKVLIKYINNKNRYAVNLYKEGKRYSSRNISVLVAQAFLNHKPNGQKLVVDHINNISKNDKLYNLQIITHRENLTKDKKNKTGYTGAYKTTDGYAYYSEIKIKDKRKYLGRFKTPQEASQVYQDALKNIVG